jgi:class 3 adenylate cyclase/tetratricopeptide (TPR) repeat protein
MYCWEGHWPSYTRRMAAEARKTVTVVFSDVTGSTSLGEQLDPEALRRVMERYFGEMRTVLERHGGTVEKFIGDAVMAVFGIPELHEDDALRAVRAATEMREALAALNKELQRERGVVLAVRTGVNTGEVVAGDPAGGQFYATGDAVNVAARLEQAAASGEILLGEQTRRLVRDAVQLEPVDPLALKGKTDAVTAWRLRDVDESAPGFARRLDAPLIGRADELARVRSEYERARDTPTSGLCTILGAAGLGKSRLASEFAASVEDEATVLVGRCLSYGEGITYWPLAEIVSELRRRPETAALVDERVAAAVGLADAPSSTEETFYAVRKLLETLAEERPLVIVLDDVHWAEPTLLDLVEHVVDWSTDAPTFFLALARPDLLDSRPSWAATRENMAHLRLEPLGEAEADALLGSLAGADVGDAVRRRVAEAAEGNPLFLEQMIALLAEDGHGETAVPPTIQALLAARLDRLALEERAVLEPAAVVGKEFWRGAVVELAPPETEVSAVLQRLVRKEFVQPDRSSLPSEDGLRFRHVLIRDAAYAGIPKERRTDLHERFAAWLERTAPEYAEIVGYHLEQAYRYSRELGPPGEREQELAQRAAEHLGSAGRRAYARGDVNASVNLLERALALLADEDPLQFELVPDLAWSLEYSGRIDEAEEVLRRALERASALGRDRDAAVARVDLASLRYSHRTDAKVDEIHEATRIAFPIFEQAGDDRGLARSWLLVSHESWASCRWAALTDASETALLHAQRAEDKALVREVQRWLAMAYYFGPLPVSEAIARLRRQGQMEEPGQDRASALTFLAGLEGLRGNFDLARKLYREGSAEFEELGMFIRIGGRSMISGHIELLAERPEAAEEQLRRGFEVLKGMGEEGVLSTVAANLAEALCRQGRFDECEEVTRISESAAQPGDMATEIGWRVARASALAGRGELEEADRLSSEAVELAEATDDLFHHGQALLRRGEVLALAGKREKARASFEEAIRRYEAKGAVAAIPRARRLISELDG